MSHHSGFLQNNRDLLQSVPPDQYAAILTFFGQPSERQRENINTDLEVPVVIVKPLDLRLHGERLGETGRLSTDPDADAEPISDFEASILADRSLIIGGVLDPDTAEIIGYQVSATTGMRRIVDREGAVAFETEVGIEKPLLDPIDFTPNPVAVAKTAAGIGGKVILKAAASAAAAKGVKSGSTLTLGVIFKLRKVAKALAKAGGKAGGKTGIKAVFGAGKTLTRPVMGQAVKAGSGPIDVTLLELATLARAQLVEAGVDWGKSNVATAKLLIDGKEIAFRAVDNPEWVLHAEGALITEVRDIVASGKSVEVLQIFSERIPCGTGFAGCMANITKSFPKAEVYFGVSGPMNEDTTTRALHVIYGLIK